MEWSYYERVKERLDASRKAAAFTGAGVSAESGIPTFRGDDGIWREYPPSVYGNLPGLAGAYLLRPGRVADFTLDALRAFIDAEPNPAHRVLAEWEKSGRIAGVITQNVDSLHQDAGSRNVIELHGNIYNFRCRACGHAFPGSRERLRGTLEELERMTAQDRRRGRRALLKTLRSYLSPCERCGKSTRPDVVFFGESLPPGALERAARLVSSADLLICVGTSGVVQPAASLPLLASRNGAVIVEINPEPSALTPLAELFVPAPAGAFFAKMTSP